MSIAPCPPAFAHHSLDRKLRAAVGAGPAFLRPPFRFTREDGRQRNPRDRDIVVMGAEIIVSPPVKWKFPAFLKIDISRLQGDTKSLIGFLLAISRSQAS
jgi:hypothetical protein